MNTRKIWIRMVDRLAFVLLVSLLLASCAPEVRVGALRTESQSVELGDAKPVRVEIDFGAGDLKLTGGAEKLLEADFNYNVAELKPEVEYTNGRLVVRQPGTRGLPALRDIQDFRNEWSLSLNDGAPIDLRVNAGAGTGVLQLADLSLTRLDVSLGAGNYTVDLSGDRRRDLDVTINSGAADISVRLPRDIGVRIEVDPGAAMINAPGLTKDGSVYTNAAYGVSGVTLQVKMGAGIGRVNLEVEKATATHDIASFLSP